MTRLVDPLDQTYECPVCKEELPRSEFNESKTLAHGLESCCRGCKTTQKSRNPSARLNYSSGKNGDYFSTIVDSDRSEPFSFDPLSLSGVFSSSQLIEV